MVVEKGVTFVYPYRGKNRKWSVINEINNRFRAEIIEGRFAGRKADFDISHVERMVYLQSLIESGSLESFSRGREKTNTLNR